MTKKEPKKIDKIFENIELKKVYSKDTGLPVDVKLVFARRLERGPASQCYGYIYEGPKALFGGYIYDKKIDVPTYIELVQRVSELTERVDNLIKVNNIITRVEKLERKSKNRSFFGLFGRK